MCGYGQPLAKQSFRNSLDYSYMHLLAIVHGKELPVIKTAAFDRSATPPLTVFQHFRHFRLLFASDLLHSGRVQNRRQRWLQAHGRR